MGSECNTPSKYRYDITMSKRTRKPLKLEDSDDNNPTKGTLDHNVRGEEGNSPSKVGKCKDNDHKSLKQLINGNEKSKANMTSEESRGRNSLGEHFTVEEKQLQLVKMQQQNSTAEGVKLKGMVNRYVKALRHLIKVKRDPHIGSRKRSVLRLTI